MIELTPAAKSRFEDYLQRMRRVLRGSRAVEPEEVEANVREHVELALAGAPIPIGADRLLAVLEQLGPPERWLPEEERPAWRRVLDRLMHGPEDWRLPYLAFGAFVLSLLLLPVGIGVLFLVLSFLLSRAAVELYAERGEPMTAKRWLIVPPIAVVLFFVLLAVLFVPISPAMAWLIERELGSNPSPAEALYVAGMIGVIGGAWWIVLSGLFALTVHRVRNWFLPLTANWSRKHALVLLVMGVVVAAAGGALLFAIY